MNCPRPVADEFGFFASGLLPAIQASRTDINDILKDDSRGASSFKIGRLSRGLVVFEIALSLEAALVGAWAASRSPRFAAALGLPLLSLVLAHGSRGWEDSIL